MLSIRQFTNSELHLPDECCAALGEIPKLYYGGVQTTIGCSGDVSSRAYVIFLTNLKKVIPSEQTHEWMNLGQQTEGRVTENYQLELRERGSQDVFRLPASEYIELRRCYLENDTSPGKPKFLNKLLRMLR